MNLLLLKQNISMDLSNIKMIVSDMDGTLLNSKEQVSHLFFEQFNKLQELGIHFVAASGRQYNSIAQKLHPIKNLITIVGENGGVIKRENKTLLLQTFDPQKVVELIPALRNINNTSIILCGEDTAFIESEDQNFISMFQEYYSAHEIVKDLTTIPHKTPIIKIALYHPVSSEQFIYPSVKKFEETFLLKISGKNWLDISNPTSNKGTAIQFLQKEMNITPEQTMVFGDYLNDLEMLEAAYYSYAMKNAHENVKKTARFITESNTNLGVEKIIQQVIKAKAG
jgi:Cof subfamily protein (haloacid dehalogenase superfamily)